MKPLISIIIPAYNAEKTIKKTIQSTIEQTYKNIEVIIIDDGSKDNTSNICNNIKRQFPQIHYYHQINQGANQARYHGVKQSKGEYIVFLDADDYLPKNSIETLYHIISEKNVEIVASSFKCKKGMYNSNEYLRNLLNGHIPTAPHSKIFKRSIFDYQTFNFSNKIIMGEDLIMNAKLANNAKQVYIINKKIYNYIKHNNSITHTFKQTIQYELLFFRELENSINTSIYRKEILYQKLNSVKNFAYHNIQCKELKSEIINTITKFNIPLSFGNYIILHYQKKYIVKPIIIIDKILNKIISYVSIYYHTCI